jgi:hypothetical protein
VTQLVAVSLDEDRLIVGSGGRGAAERSKPSPVLRSARILREPIGGEGPLVLGATGIRPKLPPTLSTSDTDRSPTGLPQRTNG